MHRRRVLLINIHFSEFVVMYTDIHVLKQTKLISDMLQSPKLDLSAAAIVQECNLNRERNETSWHCIWELTKQVADNVEI